MEINNIDLIKPFLKWNDPNDFYFVQILRRKKENPDNTSNSQTIKNYFVHSVNELDAKYSEMKILAQYFHARVYINLNRRNYEHLALHMMKKITDCMINRAYKSIQNGYESICCNFHFEKTKKWVVDLDDDHHDENDKLCIHKLIQKTGGNIHKKIPTPNGVHLITSPFNTQELSEQLSAAGIYMPDIHKNNPTLLYYSDNEIIITTKF